MSEQDLIDLGFERHETYEERYFYYSYDIGNVALLTVTDDEVKDGNWFVYAWDIDENLVFKTKQAVKDFIEILKQNTTK